MTKTVEVSQVGINDIGVIPRDGISDYLPLVNQYDNYEKNISVQIILDKNNEYNITQSLIVTSSDCELYDKNVKILQWHYGIDGKLIVESYTDKQVNLFADLKTKECLIRAKGPLFIKGKIDSESTIAIDADALFLAEPLKSDGAVRLTVRQGLGLLAPIKAQHLVIDAAYIHQEADLEISGQFDASTQYFKQDASTKTRVGSLRLIASQCQIRGDLTVDEKCFLIAESLVWGLEGAQTTLRLLGDNHLHARNLYIQGDTQASIGYLNNSKDGHFIVDQYLLIDEAAIVNIFNTEFSIRELNNQGELLFHQCITKVDIIQQQGICDAEQSVVIIPQSFVQSKRALTEFKNTNFTAPIINISGGQFNLDDCNYKGESCNVSAGVLNLQNQSEVELNNLSLLKEAILGIKDSKVSAHQFIQSYGDVFFENANIDTSYFNTIENKTTIKHSKIRAQTQIELKGITELTDSHLNGGKFLTLKGDLIANDVRLKTRYLKIVSELATINSLHSDSKVFHLQGSKKEGEVIFKKSVLTAKLFSCLDHITLEKCALYGVSQEKLSQNLQAQLKLIGTRFITESQLNIAVASQLELDHNSSVRAGLIHSQGAMKAKDSRVVCDILWQEKCQS